MNGLSVDAAAWAALGGELRAWSLYGSKSDADSAIQDYTVLLTDHRSLLDRMTQLEAENDRMKREKQDLMGEITAIKHDAFLEVRQVEASFRQKIQVLEEDNKQLRRDIVTVKDDMSKTKQEAEELLLQKTQLCLQKEDLEVKVEQQTLMCEDLRGVLADEQEARAAATEELQARLNAKERAEQDRDAAEARVRSLETELKGKATELVQSQLAAQEEIDKARKLQKALETERLLLDEAHLPAYEHVDAEGEGEDAQGQPGFNLGSMFGMVGNALRSGAASMTASVHASMKGRQGDAVAVEVLPEELPPPCEPIRLPDRVFRRHQHVHGGGCNSVAFSPSGLYAATAGNDGSVRIWTVQDGMQLLELRSGYGAAAPGVMSVRFAEEKKLLLGACNDSCIRAWDMHTGRERFTMTGHTSSISALSLHPQLPRLASCETRRLIKIWSLENGICKCTIHTNSRPNDVAYGSDGSLLAAAHFNGALTVYDSHTGAHVRSVEVHRKECLAVMATPLCPSSVVTVGRDSVVCVVDIYLGKVLKRIEHPDLHVAHQPCIHGIAADDSHVCVGTSSGIIVVLDLKDSSLAASLQLHKLPVTCVAWNHLTDVVMASVDKNGDVAFWQARSEAALLTGPPSLSKVRPERLLARQSAPPRASLDVPSARTLPTGIKAHSCGRATVGQEDGRKAVLHRPSFVGEMGGTAGHGKRMSVDVMHEDFLADTRAQRSSSEQ